MSNHREQGQKMSLLYREEEAIAHVQTLPGIQPVRFFKILFPLYEAEVQGTYEEAAPYELITKYIERAIREAELRTAQQLATFFSLEIHLVNKVLSFLRTMGHVEQYQDGTFYLTERGKQSLKDGVMYTHKETRRKLYFEGVRLRPLESEHYERSVRMLPLTELDEYIKRRGFKPLNSGPWSPYAVEQLEKRLDRAHYNLPVGIHHLKTLEAIVTFLPMYIIETYKQQNGNVPYYIVYTRIRDKRDHFFENIMNEYQDLRSLLALEGTSRDGKKHDIQEFWRKWIGENGFSHVRLEQASGGIWQAVFSSEHFSQASKFSLASLGTYHIEHNYFLRIWCNNQSVRKEAAFERTIRIIRQHKRSTTVDEIQDILLRFTEQLMTGPLSLTDLREYAFKKDMADMIALFETIIDD